MERLCRLLTALGQDIRIVVQPKPRSHLPLTSPWQLGGAVPGPMAQCKDLRVGSQSC